MSDLSIERRAAVGQAEPPAVLHVAGRVTEAVFSLLGPLTRTLRHAGVAQTVVLIDTLALAHQTARFADEVLLRPVPETRPSWRHWQALRELVRHELAFARPTTVHFHGLKPWLVAADLARSAGIAVCLSPHGSSWWRTLAARAGGVRGDVTVDVGANDTQPAPLAPDRRVDAAVDESFFAVERREARRALIVGGCHRDNRKAIELFCRMAVIFGASELDLAFNWFGSAGGAARERLHAAGVGSFDALGDPSLASRLAAGWVFVACGGERGFPVLLAEAMAAGLPCLVADAAEYRALVRDGQTGLVYRDEDHALELLTLLLDTPALRARLGNGARREALRRFTAQRLGAELEGLYLADHAAALRRIAA